LGGLWQKFAGLWQKFAGFFSFFSLSFAILVTKNFSKNLFIEEKIIYKNF
jgi:hypothetical protein